jgi:uncharacterized protein with GYD domain
MPKYLFQASYTPEGFKGLQKDQASGRKEAVAKAVEAIGGKIEAFYYAFGAEDAILILDLPDNTAAAALSLTVAAGGLVQIRTTPLLTIEEVDEALKKKVSYKAPGR